LYVKYLLKKKKKTKKKKSPSQKRAGRVVQGIGPEFKPQYHKKKILLNTYCRTA
jgi:hypothetical protein